MILPKLRSSSLISMGQLCDDGFEVVLTQNDLTVVKGNKIILRGKRNPTDGLWDIPIEKTTITSDNVVLPTTYLALYLKPGNGNKITPRQKIVTNQRKVQRNVP